MLLPSLYFETIIAFKQFYPYTEAKFTIYIIFLNDIVNTSEDVSLLRRNGIIGHMYGSDQEVACPFNELIEGNFIRQTIYFSGLYKEVN